MSQNQLSEFPPLDGLKLWQLLQNQISGDSLKVNQINFEGNIHPPHNMQQEINIYNEDHRMKMNQAQLHHHHHHNNHPHHHHHQDKCNCPLCVGDKKNSSKHLDLPHHNQIPIAHSHQILHQPNQQTLAKHTHPHIQNVLPTASTHVNLSCSVCHKKIRNSKKQQLNPPTHPPICDKCNKSQKNLYNHNNLHGNSQNNHSNNNNNNNNAQNLAYSHPTTHNSHGGDYNERQHKANRSDLGKQFMCSKCSKGFSNGGNLKRHLMIHTGEKPYSCQVCNKSFRSKTLLENHLRTHTGEKPFLCTMCDKKFSKSENLKRHVKIHIKTM